MNKTLLTVWMLCAGALVTGSATAGESAALAQRHAAMNVPCQSCHGVKLPKAGARVTNTQCLKCHQSYEALAARTQKLEPNPHRTHLGNVRCTDCHSGHGTSRLVCNDCHKFDLTPR